MPIQEQLFWRKYRPKTITNMVLLPRIKKYLENGFQQNVILYGHPGTGKSTIVDILLKDKHYKKINASLKNGVDTLREEIMDFCDTRPSPFVRTDDRMKYVYLEEFDKTTDSFQEAFKAFIEDYETTVRFIISMNDITHVNQALYSRFTKVCFNPSNDEERNYLLSGYHKYLLSVAKHAKIQIEDNIIKKIIYNNFPDLRSSVQELQTIQITGNQEITISGDNTRVFDFIMNGENNFSDNFYFVMDNWVNQPKELIDILSRPFYHFLLNNHKEVIKNYGFQLLELSKRYNAEFEFTTDPPLHVFSYICEIKNILNK